MNLQLLASINNSITDDEIKKTIELVGLNPDDKIPVKKFSLGMKQRLGIAQAIMEKPRLLILDEPMNSLDEEGVILVRDILLRLKKASVAILISSHIKDDIESLCDIVYSMSNGELI
jgi:ABC-2 type transport system ATP-binding protein